MTVQMESVSSSNLLPFNQSPASQKFLIVNPAREALRMRFKIQYCINGAIVSEMGDFTA